MILVLLYLFTFLISFVLTYFIRRFALATQLLDVPNARSSHELPTPRGGGLAFVLSFLLLITVLYYLGLVNEHTALAIFVGGGSIAILGYLDDRYNLSAAIRLTGHLLACGFVVLISSNLNSLILGKWLISSSTVLYFFALFFLVWMLNLYNFMDGIDGLAASEAIFVGISAAFIYSYHGYLSAVYLPLALAIAVSGFFIWNFPPARIFMGDAGSGFLGLMLGLMALQANSLSSAFWWSWLILLGVFIVDSTLTLVRRAYRKEKIWHAHCTHAYQQAVRIYGAHRPVTLCIIVINVMWLLPWAVIAASKRMDGLICCIIAYLPLIALAFYFNAGREPGISFARCDEQG